MSLLSIAQAVAKNTGIEVPETVHGDDRARFSHKTVRVAGCTP